MSVAWARSEGYASSVALGPTQAAVYQAVLGLTDGGRRPFVTLADLGARVGKPVSSVHDALRRLRALGLIGCAARMGRHGGHRLWRVGGRLAQSLDAAKRSRAIARIVARFSGDRTGVDSERRVPPAPVGPPGPDTPGGPSFGDRMRDAGFTPWWREKERSVSDGDDRGRATSGDNRGADVLGLALEARSTG